LKLKIENKKIIKAIKVLIIVTAFIGLNPFAMIVTIPTYIILSILFLISDLTKKQKLQWILIPITTSLIIIFLSMFIIYTFKL
jgi:hypothetical protein